MDGDTHTARERRENENLQPLRRAVMPIFRDPGGVWKTFAAVTYAVAATLGGLKVIAQGDEALASAAGVLALAHGRVIAAYIVHECAHSSVFFERKLNTALGIAMLWIGESPLLS